MSRHHATCGRRGGWAFSETPKLPHSYMLGQQGIRTGQIMSYRIESLIVVWQGWLLEQPQCYGPVHRSCQCGSVVRAQLNMLCHDANVADKPVLLSIEILVMQRRGKKRAGKVRGVAFGSEIRLITAFLVSWPHLWLCSPPSNLRHLGRVPSSWYRQTRHKRVSSCQEYRKMP